jgi:hypothetical protein
MRRATIVILAMGLALPGLAWSDWRYAHWGQSPDELAAASGGAIKVLPPPARKKHSAPWNSETAAIGTYIEGALRLRLSFSFDLKSGGLSCVVFEAQDGSPNELLKKMFVSENGPPQTAANDKSLGMETLSWSKPKDQIGLTLMAEHSFATQCKPGTNPPVE